jgi:hypothetical protein
MDKIKIRPRGCEVLLICVLLGMAGLGFFAYRRWKLPHEIASNERNVAAMIKCLASAEADFRGNDRDQNGILDFWTGDVAGLYRLQIKGEELRLIERGVGDADVAPLVSGTPPIAYRGYYFLAMKRDESETPPEDYRQGADKAHHPAKFGFCAYPVKYGVTGRNTFIINEGNTVFWSHTNGEPMDHWPSDQDRRQHWWLGD